MTFRKTLSRVLLAVMLCLAALPVFAQEDQPPAIPDPEDEAAMEEQMQAEIERWQREFESRSVYDFRIAYLIAPDALPADHIASEQMIVEMTGAQVFGDWETFAAENEAEPFQILLIHDSMYEQIDVTVTQAAYRNRVIIFGMGMPFDHLVEVTGDRCIEEPNPAYRDQAHNDFLYFFFVLSLEDETIRDEVEQLALDECVQDYSFLESWVNILSGVTNPPISDLGILGYLESLIVAETIRYEIKPLSVLVDGDSHED